MTGSRGRLISPYLVRDSITDATTRAKVARFGYHDWHSMPHTSYEPTEPHESWNANSLHPSANPSLALMYSGANMGPSKDDFQFSQYLEQPLQRHEVQPQRYQFPGHSCFTASEYYDTNSYTSSEQLTQDNFMEGMSTHPGVSGRQKYVLGHFPSSPEVHIKQSPSEEDESYSLSGLKETSIVSFVIWA